MNFYTGQHKFYCGIDLHARKMYLCILDAKGEVKLHRNMNTDRDAFLRAIEPYREDLVVAVECMFAWYWIADLCRKEGIPFVLGHALYMKAIHGGKAKNDKIDSHKIAVLLKGGMIPMSYVYPEKLRATRDLMRRRNHLVRKRAELLTHIQNTNSQYNLDESFGCIAKPYQRGNIVGAFENPSVKKSMEVDLKVIETYDTTLLDLERTILKLANSHDPVSYALLQSVYGIGKICALTILYEIEDIRRFPTVQDFVSYARLVKCAHESNGKKYGMGGSKIGNAHLKWAFSEAAALFLRGNEPAKKWFERLTRKHGKSKALSILAHKLGRAVYFMLKNKEAFDMHKFLR
ncbi:MAG: Transposase IS116/IS110/IS902 family protein [Syntrophorhabdus sp. PtaB.Bin006]|nr:MAG: Transposase IS116/IS110/IS902 family protein [Syntrophorhabdus sp. PtaB.Bin006]